MPSTTRALPNTPFSEELEREIQNSHRILTRYRARVTGEQPQDHPINRPCGSRIEEPTTAPSQATNAPNFWLEETSTGGTVRQLFTQLGSGPPPSPPGSPPDSPHHSSHSSGSHYSSSSTNSSSHNTPPTTPQGSPNRTPSPPPNRNMANRPWLD